MGWAEYSPCIFFTGGKANPWLLAQQWDPWEDKAGKQSPAIGIPPGSHTRFPISDTSTTAVGTSLFCALGLQKRQSKFQRIGKEGKFCSFRAYGQQASKHTKSRDFFVLSAPKQIQDHMDFRRNIPLDFICYRPYLNLAFQPIQHSHLLCHISPTILAMHRSLV